MELNQFHGVEAIINSFQLFTFQTRVCWLFNSTTDALYFFHRSFLISLMQPHKFFVISSCSFISLRILLDSVSFQYSLEEWCGISNGKCYYCLSRETAMMQREYKIVSIMLIAWYRQKRCSLMRKTNCAWFKSLWIKMTRFQL